MLRRVRATAVREFKATAMTKAFIFGTFVLPLVIWGVLGAAAALGLFNPEKKAVVGTIAVVDSTPGEVVATGLEAYFTKERQDIERQKEAELAKQLLEQVPGGKVAGEMVESQLPPSPEVTVERVAPGSDVAALQQRVQTGDLLAVIVATPDSLEPPPDFLPGTSSEERKASALNKYELILGPKVEAQISEKIRDGVKDTVIGHRFRQAGVDRESVSSLLKEPEGRTKRITESGKEAGGGEWAEKLIPLIAVALLLMAVLTGASYLLMSTVEEKSSRVIEVLLSGISPTQLMAGKVLGQGAVGLIILVVYGASGVAAAIFFNSQQYIPAATLWLLVAYFFIGYFMFAGMFAAIGAAVNDAREAQALQGPVIGVIILLIYLSIFAGMQDTNSTLMKVLSFVPISTPFTMSMRVANPTAPPSALEIGVSLLVGALGVVFFIWASAKIFRIGLLMYGKPPTLMGLIKWVRTA